MLKKFVKEERLIMNDINELIQGAIDMHVHANPDISLKHR